jgi:hypothetical protein
MSAPALAGLRRRGVYAFLHFVSAFLSPSPTTCRVVLLSISPLPRRLVTRLRCPIFLFFAHPPLHLLLSSSVFSQSHFVWGGSKPLPAELSVCFAFGIQPSICVVSLSLAPFHVKIIWPFQSKRG